MKLKSFGCSFIFGSELSDNVSTFKNPIPSKLSWPSLLAQHLSLEYECYASPGSGNLQIAEQILKQATDSNTSDLFVIGWTWIDRFDHWDSLIPKWKTVLPNDESELTQLYYKELHSEYRDKLTTLMTVQLVINALEQKGIPFKMTYMDELMFDQKWHTNSVTLNLQKCILPYMTTFEGKTFLDWSRSNGYPESTLWHPLEAAHRAAGDYMIKVFDKQNITDPTQ
jgi:hypothetical protein